MSEPTTETDLDEDELSEQERINKHLEEETGAIVQTEYGERYRGLVISNSGDRDEPTSV